jgi:23S rRNA (uracil1939-C5)-methyltransferase
MRGFDGSRPAVGDQVEVVIESVAFGGEGVARHGEYVIFVPDVIPGEKVTVSVTQAKRAYGRAVPVRVLEPSPDRVEPGCQVYGLCGGCQYQHVTYRRSLELKERQVKEVMLRIGGLDIEGFCNPIRPAPEAYGYRNVISLHVRSLGNRWQVGYFARDNKTLVPVSRCPIASKAINDLITDIEARLKGFDHGDRIKALTIKNSGASTLIFPVYQKPLRFMSEDRLSYRLKHITLSYTGGSFFQVNHAMLPDLLTLACDGLAPERVETLLDLYAGVGLFSLALADKYSRVIGIEAGEEAVACFEANIRDNRLRNVTVVRGTVEANIEAARREIEGKPAAVLLDPPRAGLADRVVRFLKDVFIRKLVYVSCDPATLARDLKKLAPSYALRSLTPLDMFPQTKHIEVVAVLERIR